jgi:glutathione synthase/RimK-type ligase-like ATP-grasp enzyme
MILILSNKWDLTVDFVVAELRRRRHAYFRLNTEDLSTGIATVRLPGFRILASKGDVVHDLTDVVSVIWNRRPGKPFDDVRPQDRPTLSIRKFVDDQWYAWLEGLQLIPDVYWINHPKDNDAMESKIRQLQIAKHHGFQIPDTVVTNDHSEAQALLRASMNGLVAKALYSPLIEEADQDYFVFTSRLEDMPPDTADEMRQAPIIFQHALFPKTDYRVTVVGDRVFPVRITLGADVAAEIDWRTVKDDISFTPCELPESIVNLCRSYVQKNSLVFGAIDLVEYQGEFYFLEINPNGEWGWLQKPTGIPIAEALCDLMIRHDIRG